MDRNNCSQFVKVGSWLKTHNVHDVINHEGSASVYCWWVDGRLVLPSIHWAYHWFEYEVFGRTTLADVVSCSSIGWASRSRSLVDKRRRRHFRHRYVALAITLAACGSEDSNFGANGVGANGNADQAGAGGQAGSIATASGGSESMSQSMGSGGSGEQTSTSTGGGAGGEETSPPSGCASTTSSAQQIPANLLFVLDRSGSMNCNPPNGREELAVCQGVAQLSDEDTKWQITADALSTALEQLAQQDRISAGLTVFPLIGGNPQDVRLPEQGPDVEIEVLSATHLAELQQFILGVTPRGETPLANATLSSYELLRQKIIARQLPGNTFVILMTDGTETASQTLLEQLVDTWVGTAFEGFGIRTFVIGAPGSEAARSTLSQIAFDGATASSDACDHSGEQDDAGNCHLDMTTSVDFASDLSQALLDISRDRSLACDFAVPSNSNGSGVNLNQVNVSFSPSDADTEDVLLDDVGVCGVDAEGWQFNDDQTRIFLCGNICDRVRADITGEVGIVLGCPTVRRPR